VLHCPIRSFSLLYRSTRQNHPAHLYRPALFPDFSSLEPTTSWRPKRIPPLYSFSFLIISYTSPLSIYSLPHNRLLFFFPRSAGTPGSPSHCCQLLHQEIKDIPPPLSPFLFPFLTPFLVENGGFFLEVPWTGFFIRVRICLLSQKISAYACLPAPIVVVSLP